MGSISSHRSIPRAIRPDFRRGFPGTVGRPRDELKILDARQPFGACPKSFPSKAFALGVSLTRG